MIQQSPASAPALRQAAGAGWGTLFCVSAAVGGVFYAIGAWTLTHGHPHEDACILYRYAEHIVQGHGIVYNAGGPRAEGATDFLWLVAISGLHASGLDVAYAALLLNALGAALAAGLVAHLAREAPGCGVPVAASLVLGSTALAAYAGFSTMLYAALAGACFATQLARDPRGLLALPLLGLLVGLVRPDGVLLGLGFTGLGALRVWRTRERAAYVGISLGAALLGVAYFVWRLDYFGEWLPLPLYVKSHPNVAPASLDALPERLRGLAARLQGVESSLRWLISGQGPAPLLGVLGALTLRLWRRDREAVRRTWMALVPGAILLAALGVSWPAQNVQFRFQAPVLMMLTLAMVAVAGRGTLRDPGLRRAYPLAVAAALLPTLYFGLFGLARIGRGEQREYMESFAPRLGAWLGPEDQVVLTEAGRIAFYTTASVYDLGGLNEPETARTPPRLARLRELDPEVVMYHHADLLDLAQVLGPERARRDDVVSLTREELARSVRAVHRDLVDRPPESYAASGGRSRLVAPAVATRFLVETEGYALFAVDYRQRDRFHHVYGFRRDRFDPARVEEALRAACAPDAYVAYAELRRRNAERAP